MVDYDAKTLQQPPVAEDCPVPAELEARPVGKGKDPYVQMHGGASLVQYEDSNVITVEPTKLWMLVDKCVALRQKQGQSVCKGDYIRLEALFRAANHEYNVSVRDDTNHVHRDDTEKHGPEADRVKGVAQNIVEGQLVRGPAIQSLGDRNISATHRDHISTLNGDFINKLRYQVVIAKTHGHLVTVVGGTRQGKGVDERLAKRDPDLARKLVRLCSASETPRRINGTADAIRMNNSRGLKPASHLNATWLNVLRYEDITDVVDNYVHHSTADRFAALIMQSAADQLGTFVWRYNLNCNMTSYFDEQLAFGRSMAEMANACDGDIGESHEGSMGHANATDKSGKSRKRKADELSEREVGEISESEQQDFPVGEQPSQAQKANKRGQRGDKGKRKGKRLQKDADAGLNGPPDIATGSNRTFLTEATRSMHFDGSSTQAGAHRRGGDCYRSSSSRRRFGAR